MRRNLRLDWRALALLGALLSIIIDWPGLVYAMPTILPAVAVAVAAPKTDTLNVIKNDNILSFFPYEHGPEHVAYSVKDEFTGHATETSQSFTTTNRPLSDLQTERTTQEQLPEVRETISVQATETEVQEQRLTTNEKQQVNENLYSISHQNINDTDSKGADDEATAIHQQLHQNSRRNETQHSGTKAEDQTAEEEVPTANTHIMDLITTTAAATQTTTSAATATATPPSNIISSNINTNAITTTESSFKIQSTLMPSTNTDDDTDEESTDEFRSSFQFTSSHHLAILSRTERSIRSSSSSSSTVNTKNLSGAPNGATRGGGGAAAGGGGGGMVRRSSDMSGGAKSKRLNNSRNLHNKNNLDRNERSTVSHLSGPSRKIQLYIKNRFLQLMPDGTVNGTQDDQSEYTILQRSTVDVGRIKIQGVATCLYLCMDPCGAVYGSKDFTDDCVFNENMEQHNYNTYSSTYNSNARRKYYLALNRHGEPRKLQIPPTRSLGKLATYTNAITETVPQERVEQLIAKNFGANRIKHGIRQLCDTGKPLIELVDSKNFKARPKCNPNSSSNSNSNSNNNGPSNSRKHSLSNSSSSSSSSSSLAHSNSGQLLNNVPAANDKSKLSTSNSSSSSSSNSKPETNSSYSSSSSHNSHSSISNRQNNGHISDSNSSSTTTTANTSTTTTTNSSSDNSSSSSGSSNSSTMKASGHHHNGERGKKKLRKCRPHENEEEHHCQRKPQPLRNGGGNPAKQRRCKELLQQQQQAGVTDIVLPPMCHKKGPKKGGPNGKNKRPPGEGRGKNGLGTDGLGPNNRRGKKLNVNGGRQSAKPNQNGGNTNGAKKKQKNPKRGGGGNNKKKQPKTTSTTTSTTEKASSSTHSTSDSTSTLRPGFWETTSLMPSSTLFENYDPHAENTSDRGDREQRNVRYSMEESLEMSSEDTSAANEDNGEDDDDLEGDNAEDAEDASYEDDSYVPTSSHIPYAEAGDASHTPLTSSADDFLYYDQLDL